MKLKLPDEVDDDMIYEQHEILNPNIKRYAKSWHNKISMHQQKTEENLQN